MTRFRGLAFGIIFGSLFIFAGFSLSLGDCLNTVPYARGIPLGVSGSNLYDYSRLYCCCGTLGCLVQDSSGTQYILSNNHVLARTNLGRIGDPIIQPGLADAGCILDPSDMVATLSKFVPLNFKRGTNYVDAALAQVVDGMVDPEGIINCLLKDNGDPETVDPATYPAVVGMAVRKVGRTTGLTSATVGAVNVSLYVIYNKTCGFGSQTALFRNQILINGSSFSAGGDSGSLVLSRDPATDYLRPVGLLFAGGPTTTIANPIDAVLRSLGTGLTVIAAGGSGTPLPPAAPAGGAAPRGGARSDHLARFQDLQKQHEDAILATEGVVGMGIGLAADGQTHRLEIYVKKKTPELLKRLPQTLNGEKVRIVETGVVRAL